MKPDWHYVGDLLDYWVERGGKKAQDIDMESGTTLKLV